MIKKGAILFLMIGLFIPTVNAFVVYNDLNIQIASYANTVESGDEVMLIKKGLQLQKLFINPNFPTWRDMYLSTERGIYVNRQYDAAFSKHASLSLLFPNGLNELKFEGDYKINGMILAYSSDAAYMSYNMGDTWTDITPVTEEEILFADFGPNYGQNNQLYFITNTGLYRRDMSSGAITQLVESETSGSVKNFRYVRTQNTDSTFYVVNGTKLLRTENFGSTWFEHDFGIEIKDFEIKQKTATTGHLMVLTDDNKIHYATTGFTFFDLDVPSEISEIYAVDYIILTDVGFYITYDDGDTWSKLDYDPTYITNVLDYDFAMDGTLKSFYVINDGTLYRDYDLTETFEEYMGGLDLGTAYATSGTAISKNLLDLNAEQFAEQYSVANATLIADGDLNGGTMSFYMTADGTNWEAVTPGVNHVFASPGRDLKWKVEMATADTSKTPVLRSVNVDFGMDSGCAGFTDIAVDDPYCPAITYVRAQGIFSGYPDGTFGAELEINRAETVKVITLGFNYDIIADDGTNLGFSDAEVGSWYIRYLATAKADGIIEGYPDGTFKPADTVNYVEMMKIFLETASADMAAPAAGSAWYQKYVDYANANGLTVYENLDAGMKRADVAQLFYDYSELPGN
ncbi:hypothetical protein C0416_03960 [bacterium]|nr:hypothetical protein [bacterium]